MICFSSHLPQGKGYSLQLGRSGNQLLQVSETADVAGHGRLQKTQVIVDQVQLIFIPGGIHVVCIHGQGHAGEKGQLLQKTVDLLIGIHEGFQLGKVITGDFQQLAEVGDFLLQGFQIRFVLGVVESGVEKR